MYSDNPLADFYEHDAEQERKRKRLPHCSECHQPIEEDYAYKFDGEWICGTCLTDNHREWVEYEY